MLEREVCASSPWLLLTDHPHFQCRVSQRASIDHSRTLWIVVLEGLDQGISGALIFQPAEQLSRLLAYVALLILEGLDERIHGAVILQVSSQALCRMGLHLYVIVSEKGVKKGFQRALILWDKAATTALRTSTSVSWITASSGSTARVSPH